jgi:hypothetical protein
MGLLSYISYAVCMIAVYVRVYKCPVYQCVLGCKVGVCLYQIDVACDDMMILVDGWRGQCIMHSLLTELGRFQKSLIPQSLFPYKALKLILGRTLISE